MRKTQKEQIKEAKQAFLMLVNNPKYGDSIFRYAVYLQNEHNELVILWPVDSHDNKLVKKELLPHQVHSSRKDYPAFHFALGGCGYSKSDELGSVLQQINPDLTVWLLQGYMPTLVRSPKQKINSDARV